MGSLNPGGLGLLQFFRPRTLQVTLSSFRIDRFGRKAVLDGEGVCEDPFENWVLQKLRINFGFIMHSWEDYKSLPLWHGSVTNIVVGQFTDDTPAHVGILGPRDQSSLTKVTEKLTRSPDLDAVKL
jgi:hypothetical protein